MGAVNHFLRAGAQGLAQKNSSEALGSSQLVMTWITHAQNGFKIDRSTHVDISQMGGENFKTMDAARAAVVKKAGELGIPKELVLFPQHVHFY